MELLTSTAAIGRRTARPIAALLLLVPLTVACDGESRVPPRLVDGTPAPISQVHFAGVDGPVIETSVRSVPPGLRTECGVDLPDAPPIRRVGVSGESVTSRSRRTRTIRACDRTHGATTCGVAYARLRGDVPLDPRLSLTCRNEEGEPVGFVWLVPGADAAFVVVEGEGFAEAYPTAGDFPIRVTTTSVDVESSSGRAIVSEHRRSGARLRGYVVDAQVSG